jgi:hypothetical protein
MIMMFLSPANTFNPKPCSHHFQSIVESASSVPENASTIKVRLPYLYLCLEIVVILKMGPGVNALIEGLTVSTILLVEFELEA